MCSKGEECVAIKAEMFRDDVANTYISGYLVCDEANANGKGRTEERNQ